MYKKVLLVFLAIVVLAVGAYAYYPKTTACGDLDLRLDVQGRTLTLTVVNTGDRRANLKFSTSLQADFVVLDGDHPVWTWSDDQMFAQVVTTRTLNPDESLVYAVEVPLLLAGDYTVIARFLETSCGAEVRDGLEVDYGDVRIDSGRFAGRIDTESIEVRISGVPDEIGPRVFRLSETAQEQLDQLGLEEDEVIRFEYIVDELGQDMIISVVRLVN